jgi:Protein of unknown function (DUF1501)
MWTSQSTHPESCPDCQSRRGQSQRGIAQRGQSQGGLSRRGFLDSVAGGVYAAALASLAPDWFGPNRLSAAELAAGAPRAVYDLRPRPPHFEPRAKAVIQLFMNGGPSHMDLFDPKPELTRRNGESYFEKIAGEIEGVTSAGGLMRSPFKFAQHGQSGMWVSEIMPHLAKQVDSLTFIRSMHTVNLTHEPAIHKIQSGQMLPGYPTMGAWVTYGLGSENQNLPAYVVLDDPLGLPVNGIENWQCGFLPPIYQGTRLRSAGSPILNLQPDFDEPASVTRIERDLQGRLNRMHLETRSGHPELEARISSFELAARMQMSATDALDLSQETPQTLEAYGIGEKTTDSYGRRCLMARRLVERGVRFVQLFINGQIWDNHKAIAKELPDACRRTDKPIAGLLQDLKQRGLLGETLVLWGGEFGRLPIAQLDSNNSFDAAGRDHNKNAFTLWMAGGGVKSGVAFGETDEIGFASVENKVSVTDWHATVLHLLGLDHKKLSFNRNGLQDRLTGVFEARVVKEILA